VRCGIFTPAISLSVSIALRGREPEGTVAPEDYEHVRDQLASALVGVLPGASAIGVAAPILLVVLRVIQGVAVGGEWGGSVLLSMEWGKQNRRGLMASWPQIGVPIGLLLGTGMMTVIALGFPDAFKAWAWRIPFLASLILVAIGLWVRLKVMETPVFAELVEKKAVAKMQPRPFVDSYTLPGGKAVRVLGEGRLINLAAGEGPEDQGVLGDGLTGVITERLQTEPELPIELLHGFLLSG